MMLVDFLTGRPVRLATAEEQARGQRWQRTRGYGPLGLFVVDGRAVCLQQEGSREGTGMDEVIRVYVKGGAEDVSIHRGGDGQWYAVPDSISLVRFEDEAEAVAYGRQLGANGYRLLPPLEATPEPDYRDGEDYRNYVY